MRTTKKTTKLMRTRKSGRSKPAKNPGLVSKVKAKVASIKSKRKTKKLLARLDWDKKPNPKKGSRKRNPAGEAREVFELFHGVPSKEVIEYQTRFHIHENLAGLGQLTELVFFTPGAKPQMVTLTAEDLGDAMWLCCSEDRKQLYILGELEIDLEQLGYRDDVDVKDAVELGKLTNIVYRTQKTMHEMKMLEYDHALGKRHTWQKQDGVGPEMNKAVAECPTLVYYPREGRLALVGGQYLVLEEGITN